MVYGQLETPSLAELRNRALDYNTHQGPLELREVVGDVIQLHTDEANAGALFQVASQFNLLEMVSPSVSPEEGVDIYEHDHTQGPACSISAGAGTIYRNYFANVNGQIGQSSSNQIDCLNELGRALGNTNQRLWEMRNGYALASQKGLYEISRVLNSKSEAELDALRQRLRIGIQWNTQVTLNDCRHLVTQVFCSAMPVAYSRQSAHLWGPFAKLVLEAAYEATLYTAVINSTLTNSRKVFLTLLGGGAFGNETDWILAAIDRSLHLFSDSGLDIAIVSYGSSKSHIRKLVASR
jgi:hypothetical protein